MKIIGANRRLWICTLCALLAGLLFVPSAHAAVELPNSATTTPAAQAELIRQGLVQAQLKLQDDPAVAIQQAEAAQSLYLSVLSPTLTDIVPEVDDRVRAALDSAISAAARGQSVELAVARAHTWTALLDGSYQIVLHALQSGDSAQAKQWLALREFRHATRFSRPGADATLAVAAFGEGTQSAELAEAAVRADLLDTYQARLTEALTDLRSADLQGFANRRAETAALAEGYFTLLAPAYAEQRSAGAAQQAQQAFGALRAAAQTDESLAPTLSSVEQWLQGFRAAPLSPKDQVRRANQLLRFLALVPVEYSRGIRNGTIAVDLEIREAITFRDSAAAAFADLRSLLDARDPVAAANAEQLFSELGTRLSAAGAGSAVAPASTVQELTDQLTMLLTTVMPAEWQKIDRNADFDVIAASLDQMETAVAAGRYDLAETARVDAYAILESGPEARLIAFAPQYIPTLEELFWYGQGEQKGLAYLVSQQAGRQEIAATRAQLDEELHAAQDALSGESAPFAVITNAAIIVFREGLEAVVILAALLASMVGASLIYRRPMVWGVLLALVATALTWWIAQQILTNFSRYGERLEAVVSLIAIGVLLLITNWFFHRVYWKDWMANFHSRKRALLGGAISGQALGFVLLGFTSVYREGFETVLFMQALVLESGIWVVLQGVGLGLLGVLGVGYITFRLQSRLPYKQMLVVTGILIGAVLLIMVGNTTHVLQLVGWAPLHPIRWLAFPYWFGLWFGVYATWEGLLFQAAAAIFVIGSYILAEQLQKRRTSQRRANARVPMAATHPKAG
ncbi:MAG: FTR1 family protein [Caldilineaceae bacterium]|nr:FTR1 family protein [Caldilineaceae bacterium]